MFTRGKSALVTQPVKDGRSTPPVRAGASAARDRSRGQKREGADKRIPWAQSYTGKVITSRRALGMTRRLDEGIIINCQLPVNAESRITDHRLPKPMLYPGASILGSGQARAANYCFLKVYVVLIKAKLL